MLGWDVPSSCLSVLTSKYVVALVRFTPCDGCFPVGEVVSSGVVCLGDGKIILSPIRDVKPVF